MATKDEITKGLAELSEPERVEVVAAMLASNGIMTAVLERINANGDKLFTVEQLNETIIPQRIETILPERLKKYVKRSDHEELQARHDSAKREIERLKAQSGKPDPDAIRDWQRKIDEYEKSITALNAEVDKEKAAHSDTKTNLRGRIFDFHLASALLENGANPKYIKHAVPNARRDLAQLQLSEDDTLAAIDPTSRRQLNHAEIVKGWLAANPIYVTPLPSGGGLPPSVPGSPSPPGNPMKGMTAEQRINYALKHDPAFKNRVNVEELPIVGPSTPGQGDTD